MDTPPDSSRSPLEPRRRPPWLGSLALVVLPALAVLVLAWSAAGWLTGTTLGLRTLLAAASWAVPSLTTGGVSGSLDEGFKLERMTIDEPGWSVTATQVVVVPRNIEWMRRTVDLAQLSAESVTVHWTTEAQKKEPSAPPASLALPIELNLRDARVGELTVGPRGATPQVLRDVRLVGRADANVIRIEQASASLGDSTARLSGQVGTATPFALDARAEVRSVLGDEPVQATLDASGSLLDTMIAAVSDNTAARFTARARVTAFAPVPLAALSLAVTEFEPSYWLPEVPTMRLAGSAELQPRVASNAPFTLTGDFAVSNALAGPVDRQRIPVQSARGSLVWTAQSLDITVDELIGAGGSARGSVVRSAAGGIAAKAAFSGVDAAAIHSALVRTQAAGEIDYALDKGVQRFEGRASNAKGIALAAEFALVLADDVLEIRRTSLRIADGQASVSGRIELGKTTAAHVRGEFQALDLAQFVKGIDTRLNGKVAIDGTLQPTRRGQALLTLTDSRLAGRPVEGRADLRLNGELLDVDTELRSGTAQLIAKGGLGGGRELAFELNAPRLGDLAPTLGGEIHASGSVGGTLQVPTIVASASANALALPNKHRIEKADAAVRASAAADAPLDVTLTIAGHRAPESPELSLASASLTARGTTASHTIGFDATTGTRQSLVLRAAGGWRDDAWRGTINVANVGKPFSLRLDSPAPVLISASRLTVGATSFTARETRVSDAEFTRIDGRIRTAGTFANMQPQALDSRARAPRRAVRTTAGDPQPLTLAGRWALDYADALSGIVVVERTAGDLYGGVDAVHPIGISDVGAALSIVDNRVTGTAYLRGRQLGKVDAVIDAYVDPVAMRLAQQRPFRINVDATLPDVGWIGPLIGDAVQIEGSAAINAVVGGTPADPTADGKLQGRDLRIIWIEQGLRLENGTLNAGLEDGVLVLSEMTFTGDARERPDDKRAMAALGTGAPGTLRVEGRIALQTLTGSIGVRAERLPIMQRRERWMVVSGEGGITLTPTRAELYAKPVVDGAYIDFSALRGPRTLPGDVVVVRTADEQAAKNAAPPLDVQLDVETRLGQRFYIRGAGLEARLAGSVTVSGKPSQLHALGNVRIVDGIYNGYGQRLQIQRGVLTFSGPLENPALNVLAVRTGLPVDVGVQISGTALMPSVRLYSDTAMSDVEKLNWLVLGRAPGAGESQDRAMLTAAASALFAGQSDGTSSNLMRSLGIDEFGIRSGQPTASLLPRETVAGTLRSGSSSTASADFVALGKRINDELYVTFEQAISGAEYWVALNYQLTRRLSLIARAGSTNALDLVYTLTFDRWSEAFDPPAERASRRTTPRPER